MMFWDDHGMSGWGFGLMTTAMLIFWVLIILGAVMLFRQLGRAPYHGGAGAEHRPPERLLAERFARGEIDTDEYRRRPETLRSGPGPGDG